MNTSRRVEAHVIPNVSAGSGGWVAQGTSFLATSVHREELAFGDALRRHIGASPAATHRSFGNSPVVGDSI